MAGRPGGQQPLAAVDLVGEADAAALQLVDPGGDPDGIAVAGAPAVGQLGAGDHQQVAVALDLGVVAAAAGAQGGARLLEPDQVVGVMDDAHLVGLGVADLEVDALADGWAHETGRRRRPTL